MHCSWVHGFFLHFGHLYINKWMGKILCSLQCKIKKTNLTLSLWLWLWFILLCFAVLPCQMHPSPLKRSMSLIPTSQQTSSDWLGTDEISGRSVFLTPDHAPLSPQSSVASSGSEQTEEIISGRNSFQEDGSGMKGRKTFIVMGVLVYACSYMLVMNHSNVKCL